MYPNRVVAVAAAVLTLIAAAIPVVAQTDWTSTAGILTGIAGLDSVALTWLLGWQKHEARQANPLPDVPFAVNPSVDEGDAGKA